MINGKKVLAIVPARGGSKRLPRKNLLDFCGKPLIAWSIEAAKGSKFVDKCVVTTDDLEISKIAEQFGAEFHIRPDELASDTASSVDVVLDVIEQQSEIYDYLLLLQPTSPLRQSEHVDQALTSMINKSADAMVSVSECLHSPLLANTLPESGSMDDFISEVFKNKRSQDLPKYYSLNGAIYIIDTSKFINQKTFLLRENTFSYIMKPEVSVDIDTSLDFKIASFLFSNRNLG